MPKFTFTAQSPFDGYQKEFDGVSVREITGRAIVSIATPLNGEAVLAEAVSAGYNAEMPKPGYSTISQLDNSRFLGLQQDQMLLVFDFDGPNALKSIEDRIGNAGHLTDQSDSWAILEISGPESRDALARICPVNLHPSAFPEGKVVRTLMEHMGVVILRVGPETFLTFSPGSSAETFLHAVEISVENVIRA